MLIPVRCFTCGTLIADKDVEYQKRIKAGENPKKVLDEMGVKRYCCRRMLTTSVCGTNYSMNSYDGLTAQRYCIPGMFYQIRSIILDGFK